MSETLRCPVCRAENPLGPSCRRCRADLSLLTALERQRQQLLAEAAGLLASGQLHEAVARAERAAVLRGGADAVRMQAVGQMLLGNYPEAWLHYEDADRLEEYLC